MNHQGLLRRFQQRLAEATGHSVEQIAADLRGKLTLSAPGGRLRISWRQLSKNQIPRDLELAQVRGGVLHHVEECLPD